MLAVGLGSPAVASEQANCESGQDDRWQGFTLAALQLSPVGKASATGLLVIHG